MRKLVKWPYPRVLAHRCGGALAPENTLAGLRITAMAGCGGVEFDVMLSASNTPILIHDETLERTTNGSGKVCETPDEQLSTLDAGMRHHRAFIGSRIPKLTEAGEMCQALGLLGNVEIKPAAGFERVTGTTVARAVAKIWKDAELPPLLSSFSEEAIVAAMQVVPRLPRGFLFERLPADWETRCERANVVSVHLDVRHLDAPTVRTLKEHGYRVVVYTENDAVRARTLFGWGVDTIITDRPEIVRAPSSVPSQEPA